MERAGRSSPGVPSTASASWRSAGSGRDPAPRGLADGGGEASPLVTGGVVLAIIVGIGSQYFPARVPRLVMARFSRLPVLGQAALLALALMVTNAMGPAGVAPFIYFQF